MSPPPSAVMGSTCAPLSSHSASNVSPPPSAVMCAPHSSHSVCNRSILPLVVSGSTHDIVSWSSPSNSSLPSSAVRLNNHLTFKNLLPGSSKHRSTHSLGSSENSPPFHKSTVIPRCTTSHPQTSSVLSELQVYPVPTQPKKSLSNCARVLTSVESLALLEEKEQAKKDQEELKIKRKKEREEKRIAKEKEKQRKLQEKQTRQVEVQDKWKCKPKQGRKLSLQKKKG